MASQATGSIAISQLARICHDPDTAIIIYQRFLSTGDPTASPRPSLINLTQFWLSRFDASGELVQLDKSLAFIAKAKEGLDLENDASSIGSAISIWRLEGLVLKRRFEHLGNVEDIESSITALKRASDCVDGRDWDSKAGLLISLGNSLLTRFERLGDLADIENAILNQQQAVDLTPDNHTNKPSRLNNLGTLLLTRFEQLGELKDIHNSILYQQSAVDLTSDGHINKPAMLNNLGNSFLRRFERLGNSADIDDAVLNHQRGVDLAPDGHANKPAWLNSLGTSLSTRFEELGNLEDINNAILKQGQAADLTPDSHPTKPTLLNNLGNSLFRRFERLGDLVDVSDAILKQQQAVDLTPDGHIDKPSRLNNLGNSLCKRFERLGDLTDIDNAILYQQCSIDLTPDGYVDKPLRLNSLGASLAARFERIGDLADLDSAILKQKQAVNLTPDGHVQKPMRLNNLGGLLLRRFERRGDLADINNAISYLQQAVDSTPNGHPNKPLRLDTLGTSLHRRFERLGNLADLNNTILSHQQAVDLTPDGYANKAFRMNNLAISLQTRFERLGELVDIDNSIFYMQKAINLTPDGHADKPFLLSNLGSFLRIRFDRLGDLADIDTSVLKQQEAVDLTPDGHAGKPSRLNNLGNSLRTRFDRLKDLSDINNAITKQQQAVHLTPDDDSDKASWMNNLGNSLLRRFERLKDMVDLNNAISVHQRAIDLTPDGHIDKPTRLSNLGVSLRYRFEQLGDGADIVAAVSNQQRAVDNTPTSHAYRPLRLSHLGDSFRTRFECSNKPEDRARSISCYQEAALSSSGEPSVRFAAAYQWAKFLYPALQPYHTIISLIPQVVWLGRTVKQRYGDLQTLGGVVMEAVSAACAAEKYDLALEWLEQGRAIIWGQILRLRSPIDDLATAHPELAEELNRITYELEAAGTGNSTGSDGGTTSLEQSAQQHRRLAEKWESLLITIRALPDFANFLEPKSASVLKKAATNGTVVVVNVSDHRSDALVLHPDSPSVEHIHLTTLSFKKLKSAQGSLKQFLYQAGVRYRNTERGSIQNKVRNVFPNALKMLWTDLAKPILDHLGYTTPPTTGDLPHITWCLTGPLASLPLHAAGIYDNTTGEDRLFNYAVSSYIPSLTALLEGLEKAPTSSPSILVITQEDTPNLPRLPGTVQEVNQVEVQMKNYGIHSMRMDGKQATVEAVSAAMNNHSWVHISCHAKQDVTEPMRSAFFLHNGTLELAEIMKKPLKQAELAYLSACQTAMGDSTLPDEAMHLAAGLFTAGYRSVVGTLWAIKDQDAPLVAQIFYDRLLSNPGGGVARALHAAVAALRNADAGRENDFVSWVPYIHIGH